MRIRLPELLDEHQTNAHRLVLASGKRVSLTAIYRLIGKRGHVRYIDSRLLDALCDVLGATPDELLARDDPPPPRAKRPRSRKRAAA